MDEAGTQIIEHREAWFIPIAILAAGVVLSVGIFLQRSNTVEGSVKADITLMRPVSESDHIVGSPAAPVVLVEYSDIDSAYSKTFQQTMEQVMTEYATTGDVAWVYRHMPLIDMHIHSADHAEASECIASLGGPGIFWRFIDALNSAAPNDLQFDPVNYDSVVTSLGILPQSFQSCMSSHKYQERVSSDFGNAIAIGAGGSPFSVLLVKGQPPVTIDGALTYEATKKLLDQAIETAKKAPVK